MRITKLLTKTLLVAAGMCVGANASWAGNETLINFPSSTDGISFSGTTSSGECQVNGSKIPCYQLKNGYTTSSVNNGNTIRFYVDGGFKEGDVITVAGCINNADETKYGTVVLFSGGFNKATTTLNTFDNFVNVNGNTLTPVDQQFTLMADVTDSLFLGRSGNTGTNVTKITVTRTVKNYVNVFTLDFENAETYQTGWTMTNTTTSQLDISDDKKILFRTNTNKSQSTETYDFSSIVCGYSGEYKLGFDYAFTPTGSSQIIEPILPVLAVYAGETELFHVECSGSGGSGVSMSVKNSSNTTIGSLTSQTRFLNPGTDNFYTFNITSNSSNGTTLSIKNSSGASVTLTSSTLDASYLLATKIVSNLHKTSGENRFPSLAAFDNVTLALNIEDCKTRAAEAISVYTSIKDAAMAGSEKTALEFAHTALAAYSNDEAIVSNMSGYVTAIIAMENANAAANASIPEYTFWKSVYDAADAAALTVSSDCQGTFRTAAAELLEAYNGGTLSLPANTNMVKGKLAIALINAGETDLTAVIYNAGFELGTLDGWTIAGEPSSAEDDANKYGTIENASVIDGSYHYYTGYNGRNVSQNVIGLPAGSYTLTAKAASWGASCALVANGGASNVTADIEAATTLSYTFVVAGDEEYVNLGIAGANGASAPYATGGTWGYRCDAFTLIYNGADPLANVKLSLSDEIVTATALKDSWTPKVGTTPFKYDGIYYEALVSQIATASGVLNGGSTTETDYTTAEANLETAETNMANSVQNAPDPSKYYRIYLANDGVSTGKNLNMLRGSTNKLTVTETPYAVKFTVSDGNYIICDAYDNFIAAGANNYDWGTYSSGQKKDSHKWQIDLQNNGTIIMYNKNSSYMSWGWRLGTKALTENAQVSCYYSDKSTPNNVTWIVSDAVDVADVSLSVNADAGWGTFIAPYDNLTPSAVKAYTVSYKDGNTIYFTENTTGVLSANTPYILSTEEASDVSTTFKGIATNSEDSYTVNGLVGLLTAATVAADKYILQNNDGKVGFYKTTSSIDGTANRCYLDLEGVPAEAPSGARGFVGFGIFGADATGISTVEGQQLKAESFYNLSGQRISQPVKGLYIVNGKKVVVK